MYTGSYRIRTVKNAALAPGIKKVLKKGSPGRGVTVYRIVGTGKDAKREFISEDKYPGETRVMQVGPAKSTEIVPPPPPDGPDEPINPEL